MNKYDVDVVYDGFSKRLDETLHGKHYMYISAILSIPWPKAHDKWLITFDTRVIKHDTWHMTYDTWLPTYDTSLKTHAGVEHIKFVYEKNISSNNLSKKYKKDNNFKCD